MKKKYLLYILFALSITLCAFTSCKSSQAQKQQKEIDKRKAERKKEAEIQYQNALRRHHDIQSKETRKRIKQTQKKAEKINKPKQKKFFLFRWFSKNKSDCVK